MKTQIVFVFLLLIYSICFSQNPSIKEVSFFQKGEKAEVKFYFDAPSRNYRLRIEPEKVALTKRSGQQLSANSGALKGDINTWLKPNKYYTFEWFLKDNFKELDGEYKTVVEGQAVYLKGGPSNAFYSLFLAGLGRYKLDTRKKYPAFLSITSGLLVGSGIILQASASSNYKKYQVSNNQVEIDQLFKKAQNMSRWSYVLLVPGITINVIDFLSVLGKGAKNAKYNKMYE